MIKKGILFLFLFGLLACTNDRALFYRLDSRYLNTVPQYQNGRTYVSDDQDTMRFFLTKSEKSYVVAGQNPENGKEISIERFIFNYDVLDTTLYMSIEMRTYPNLSANTQALTEFGLYTPAGGIGLRFMESDTSFFPPIQYAKEMVIKGVSYEEVFFDPDRIYYSANGELISFKPFNSAWYTVVPE